MVGCSNSPCCTYVCAFAHPEESSLGIHFCSNTESDCVALEQHFCWISALVNFGLGSFTLLSSAFSGFSLGDELIPDDFHPDGRGSK